MAKRKSRLSARESSDVEMPPRNLRKRKPLPKPKKAKAKKRKR